MIFIILLIYRNCTNDYFPFGSQWVGRVLKGFESFVDLRSLSKSLSLQYFSALHISIGVLINHACVVLIRR